MNRRLWTWLGFVAVCLAVAANTRYTADMSAFLPARPDAAQQLLVDQLRHGPVARLLLAGIEVGAPGDPEAVRLRGRLSRGLAARLRLDPAFASVDNGTIQAGRADQALLFRYRYLVGDAVDAGRFEADGLQAAIGDSIAMLGSAMGFAFKDLLVRDPGGEVLRLVDRLEPPDAPALADGVWTSADRRRALLLIQLKEDGTALDAQQAALATLQRAFAAAREDAGPAARGATLVVTGAARFAVESRDRIRADVERLSGIGALLIVLLLGTVYRSPKLLALGLLPVATGALASIAAVSLVFGEVHGITLGFGVALIGEAIDYAIYVFLQGRQPRLWRTLRLGVLTSLIGFSALLFSGFPGLAQLGLFAITGILTASVVTWALLGPMFPTAPVALPARALDGLQRLAGQVRRLGWLPAAAASAAAVVLALSTIGASRPLWQADLAALSPVGEAAKALDASLRTDLRAPDLRHVVAVSAADPQQALAGARRAAEKLQPLLDSGVLAGYDSPTRWLPDEATQLRRRAALPDEPALRRLVTDATRGTALAAGRLEPFIADVLAARTLPPLQPGDLAGTALGLGLGALLIPGPGRSTAILPLRAPESGSGALAIDVDAVRSALGSDADLHLIDIKGETDRLYGDYLDEAIGLSLAGVALIVLMIALLQSRGPGGARQLLTRLGRVVLPIGAALLCVVAGLAVAGVPLTLLHLVGLLLTVAVGSNYALFFVTDDEDSRLLASLALANLTTLIGFGILGFASVPVLSAVGQTVGPGAALCLLFAAAMRPAPAARWRPSRLIRASMALHLIVLAGSAGALIHWAATGAMLPAAAAVLAGGAVLLLANHAVLTGAGLLPRSAVLGPNLRRLPAAAAELGQVAITIDDGPDPEITPRVLDCLRSRGARATFFLIAERAERQPALVRQIVAEGHEVENHTDRHRHGFSFGGTAAMRQEIARAQWRLCRLTGRPPAYFRAPAGLRNPLLDPVLSELGLSLASWTRRGFDTVERDPARVLARLIGADGSRLSAGDILLLHDGNAARGPDGTPVILSVLPRLLDACAARGLTAVTLQAAAGADRGRPTACRQSPEPR